VRASRTAILIGVAWGLAGPLLYLALGSGPGVGFGQAVSSAILDLFWADNLIFPLKILLLPVAVGLDLAAWTIGLLLWGFTGQSWPGQALAYIASQHPTLRSWVVTVFSVVAGIGLALAAAWVVRSFRRLPSGPARE